MNQVKSLSSILNEYIFLKEEKKRKQSNHLF